MLRAMKATILGVLLLLGLAGPASAKMPCPEVLAGVEKAGKDKTPEDVATELGIPPRRVRACLRKKGAKEEDGSPVKGLRRARREAEEGEETDREAKSGAAAKSAEAGKADAKPAVPGAGAKSAPAAKAPAVPATIGEPAPVAPSNRGGAAAPAPAAAAAKPPVASVKPAPAASSAPAPAAH